MAKIIAFLLPMGITILIIMGGTACGCDTMSGGNSDDLETTMLSIGIMIEILDQPVITYPLGAMFLALIAFKTLRFKRDMRRRIRKDRALQAFREELEHRYIMRK